MTPRGVQPIVRQPPKRYDYGEFFTLVAAQSRKCWGCELRPAERRTCIDRSGGIMDAHHLLSKQTLKREVPDNVGALLMEPANGVLMGRWHHDQLEAHRWCPSFEQLPVPAVLFAERLGLRWALERRYPIRGELVA